MIPLPTMPTLRSAPRGRRGGPPPAGRRWRVVLAIAVVAGALVACQGVATTAPADAWTEAQLAQVLDLSELGRELRIAASGDHLLLDGRALDPALLARFPHLTMGRSSNLLRFADDALAAMSDEARQFVLRAAPAELRAALSGYGLGLDALRAAWGDEGTVDLAGLHAVATALDGVAPAGVARGERPGARLLADLGVTR